MNVLNLNSIVEIKETKNMPKCPQCGKEVQPKKTWKMAGRPDKAGKRTELTIALCDCCGKSFRATIGKKKI
jgi:NAD-dependent SIR2 family protein deacetylase